MKHGLITLYLLVLLILSSCSAGERYAESGLVIVTALSYLDDKPVSIDIADGKIGEVTFLSGITELPEVYVAPGLIDLQINGYMGVDFASQDQHRG